MRGINCNIQYRHTYKNSDSNLPTSSNKIVNNKKYLSNTNKKMITTGIHKKLFNKFRK